MSAVRNRTLAVPAWQRILDVVGATVLTVVLIPCLAIAVLIARFDGPNVLLRQERTGQRGRPFWMLKIRTMRENAEMTTGPTLALPSDPRLIRGGALLRLLHMDEIPQLINVFRGEMSLVGPRPERPVFVRQYLESVPGYDQRERLPPGMTGLAQIRLGYQASPEAKLVLDIEFIERRSAMLYLRVIACTPFAILRQIFRARRTDVDDAVVIDLRDDIPAEDSRPQVRAQY
jgi:lipopolysaccharide/colanic/teichoic acid biosynthesis glycosyltransferase